MRMWSGWLPVPAIWTWRLYGIINLYTSNFVVRYEWIRRKLEPVYRPSIYSGISEPRLCWSETVRRPRPRQSPFDISACLLMSMWTTSSVTVWGWQVTPLPTHQPSLPCTIQLIWFTRCQRVAVQCYSRQPAVSWLLSSLAKNPP